MRGRRLELLTAAAALALGAALWANQAAGRYVAHRAGGRPGLEGDLLLGTLPHVDLTLVFVWGFAAFLAFAIAAGLLTERRRVHYILWMYALLVGLRAFFIILTPMGAPRGQFAVAGSLLFDAVGRRLTFGNDLFFSAHTAMPFLGYLVYRTTWVRLVFLALSLALAATVLMAHLHYSIDVLAAYFITYAAERFHRRQVEPRWRRLAA